MLKKEEARLKAPMTSLTLPKSVWKEARQQLQNDCSLKITVDSILEKFKSVKSRDAALNTIVHLKKYFGLIDDDGKLTAIGKQWVNDETYPNACQLIINGIFPRESLSFLKNSDLSTDDKAKLLQKYGKFGQAGAKKTVRFFLMLEEEANPEQPYASEKAFEPKGMEQRNDTPENAPTAQKAIPPSDQATTERTIHVTFDSAFPAEKIPSRLKAIYSVSPDANFEITMKA